LDKRSVIKLIDLLSLRPGAILYQNAVTGEPVCHEAETLYRYSGWREGISKAAFPDAAPLKVQNFQKLLDLPIQAQLVIRHQQDNVVEMLRFTPHVWDLLREKIGYAVDILVDGKIAASGRIEEHNEHCGIRIHKNYS